MSSKRLIVNADGFGFGPGATEGILDVIRRQGFISSVSVNANFPDMHRIRELIKEFPWISVGVHLNALAGRPCLPPHWVPSLVTRDGWFHADKFLPLLRSGHISMAELMEEFDAQIATVHAFAADRLTHLDSQENTHLYFMDLFLTLARKWRLARMRNNASLICLESERPFWSRVNVYSRRPHLWLAHWYRNCQMLRARAAGMRMADRLITVGYSATGNKTNLGNWLRILQNLPPGTYEIYCHPAHPDATLRRWAVYCDERELELKLLCQPALQRAASHCNIDLIGFDRL